MAAPPRMAAAFHSALLIALATPLISIADTSPQRFIRDESEFRRRIARVLIGAFRQRAVDYSCSIDAFDRFNSETSAPVHHNIKIDFNDRDCANKQRII